MAEALGISNLFNVKGKTAVVSGGGSGIGLMIATAFVKNGGRVIIASRKEKQLKEACDGLNKMGPGKCEYVVADLGSKAGCDALSAEVKKRTNKVHVLVNNSGATWGAPYNDVPEAQGWDKILALNVKSLFYMTQGLTELLAKDATNIDPGRVINISSVAGLDPRAEGTGLGATGTGLWSYNTSKAAAIHLSKTLAVTLGPRYITVNTICPGVYPSKMTAYGIKENEKALSASQPMGRVGTPEDMAGLVLFLSSRGAAHLSGVVIETDGGARMSGRGAMSEKQASKL